MTKLQLKKTFSKTTSSIKEATSKAAKATKEATVKASETVASGTVKASKSIKETVINIAVKTVAFSMTLFIGMLAVLNAWTFPFAGTILFLVVPNIILAVVAARTLMGIGNSEKNREHFSYAMIVPSVMALAILLGSNSWLVLGLYVAPVAALGFSTYYLKFKKKTPKVSSLQNPVTI